MSLPVCPGLEQLERFASGRLSGAEREAVEQHLTGCELCRAKLDEIHANLAVADRLHARKPVDSGPPAAASPAETTDSVARVQWPERLTQIGPYKVLQILGEGGFGVVYLAEQTSPVRRRVALKVIKPGMDSARVIARFEAERQALAMMDHPSIARVLDAGTTEKSARPYFVMEHVPGESITAYADRHRLSTRARLELFIPVCEAVQHAHTKGVIHRDLKPGNVLVVVREGQHPVPKVIDFGIAKALHGPLGERTIFTEQGQLIGTPEYMSPEQAEMGPLDIDTRSDVYSLGVMLYELLAGARPFELKGSSLLDMVKVIREQDPISPSTRLTTSGEAAAKVAELRRTQPEALSRELKRELEWIPLKALKKDRTERYQTAADLARDLKYYLEGRPLIAAPESAGYRLRKFVKRNKGPVATASALLLTLLLGLAGTIWQARRAEDRAVAAQLAEAQAQDLRDGAQKAEAEAKELLKALRRALPVAQGRVLAQSKGCTTCHSLDGSELGAPSFLHLFDRLRTVKERDGSLTSQVAATDEYVRESVFAPQARVVPGMGSPMPTYMGQITDEEFRSLLLFLRSRSDATRDEVLARSEEAQAEVLFRAEHPRPIQEAQSLAAAALLVLSEPHSGSNHDANLQAFLAARLDPTNADALRAAGIGSYRTGDFETAIIRIKQSISREPQRAPAATDLAILAMAHWKLRQPEEARAALAELRNTAGMEEGRGNAGRWLREAEELIEGSSNSAPAPVQRVPKGANPPTLVQDGLATGQHMSVRLIA